MIKAKEIAALINDPNVETVNVCIESIEGFRYVNIAPGKILDLLNIGDRMVSFQAIKPTHTEAVE